MRAVVDARLPLNMPPATAWTSRSLAWVAIGVVVLVHTALLVRQASSPRETPTPTPTAAPTAQQAAEPPLAPPVTPAPIEQAQPPKVAPRGSSRGVVTDKRQALARSAAGISLATAQLCQTFSTSGGNWRCDPAGDSVSPGPIVLYTRVRSPRADRGRASLVSRRDTAAVREADDSCQHDGGLSHVQPADC